MNLASGLAALFLFVIVPGIVAMVLTLTKRWPKDGG